MNHWSRPRNTFQLLLNMFRNSFVSSSLGWSQNTDVLLVKEFITCDVCRCCKTVQDGTKQTHMIRPGVFRGTLLPSDTRSGWWRMLAAVDGNQQISCQWPNTSLRTFDRRNYTRTHYLWAEGNQGFSPNVQPFSFSGLLLQCLSPQISTLYR